MFRFGRKRAWQPPQARQGGSAPTGAHRIAREGSARSCSTRSSRAAKRLDLSWITDTFAIGGSFAPNQTEALAREHRLAAVVDVRGEACDDETLLARYGIELLHLPTIDFEAISPRMLQRGVAFVTEHLTAGRRVLVHCAHGVGRSALLGLCVLVECGHAPLDALALAKARRGRVSPSPAQYDAWAAWLTGRRGEGAFGWTIPTFEEFKAIAYRFPP